MAVIYIALMITAVVGFVSLSVDWGHVQATKAQLQSAVDAAARYGAQGLEHDAATARANAVASAADNTADGSSVVLNPTTDIQFGTWDSVNRVFTQAPAGSEDSATCIKVTAYRTAARGNAVTLYFAPIIGVPGCDVSATAYAVYNVPVRSSASVPASANPWLAGMPAGTVSDPVNPHNDPDYAGTGTGSNRKQSPIPLTGISITPGQPITFDSVNGGASYDPSLQQSTADGSTTYTTDYIAGAEHGMSDVKAPINALMGVFLSDAQPDSNPAPGTLDFSTPSSRDFTTLQPQLQQVFFIGDGRKSTGELQQFIPPPGATRLFLGTMDYYEWSNNVGSYAVTAYAAPTVQLVR